MAIGITYGPISAGLGLAQQSGQAQARRFNTQEDMDFLNMMNQAQTHADQKYANQVQQALGVQEFNANLGMEQQRLNTQNQHSQAELAMMGNRLNFQSNNADRNAGLRQEGLDNSQQYRTARIQNMQDNTGLAQDKFNTQQDAISNLPDDGTQDVVKATGRMPYQQQNPANQMSLRLQGEAKLLDAEIMRESRNQKSYQTDPKDLVGAKSEPGTIPGVAKGFEPQWQASQARITAAQQRLAQIQQALQQTNTTQGVPPVNTQAVIKGMQQGQAVHGGAPEQQGPKGQGEAGGGGSTPTISSAQQYAQLPSGAHYINARDGQEYVKP